MKKIFLLLLVTCLFFIASCGGKGEVEYCYIDLTNNTTGFTTSPDDTAVAVGMKKGNELLTQVNAYLDTLNKTYWDNLMDKMAKLSSDDSATYEIEYTPVGDGTVGTLKVGMECAYEPYNWMQKDNNNGAVPIANVKGKYANGYDVQIAAQIAASLNMKLEVYQYEWDALVPAVQSGSLDAICAGMSPTQERKDSIDFSHNYYESDLVIITKKGSKIENFKSLAELDQNGIKIAAQPGTFHLAALQSQTSNLTVVSSYSDFVNMRIALEAGTIDGYVAEKPTAFAICK